MEIIPLRFRDIILVQQLNTINIPENYTMNYYIYHATKHPELNFICFMDKKMVGYILSKFEDDNCGHLVSICVDFRYRKLGIAKRLLEIVMEKFKNTSMVTLKVRVSNKIAIKFYEKYGFVICEKIEEYYGDKEDAFSMMRKL